MSFRSEVWEIDRVWLRWDWIGKYEIYVYCTLYQLCMTRSVLTIVGGGQVLIERYEPNWQSY